MKSHDWIFRVLDIGAYPSGGDLFVGTGFLVSAKGYALTCWHNFDYEFALKRFEKEKEIENLRIAPRWGKAADEGNWRSGDGQRFSPATRPLAINTLPGIRREAS